MRISDWSSDVCSSDLVHGANRLLDLPDPPTAIFAANDDTAAGVIRVAGERGLSVPRELSVCGFDDTPIARHLFPALTTVRQPTTDLGELATRQLLEPIRTTGPGHSLQEIVRATGRAKVSTYV